MGDVDASRPSAAIQPGAASLRDRAGPWAWLVAALGTALTAAFFYPGYLNGDATWQYRQMLSGEYHDMHPVILPWIWGFLDRVIEGSGGLFLVTAGLFWMGLAICARVFVRRTGLFVLAAFGIGLWPPVFSMLSQLHKDASMVATLLLGFALLVLADRRRSLWPLLGSLPLLWYAVAVRHNGAAAVIPLTIWMAFLLVRDQLPSGIARRLTSATRKIVLGTSITLAMLASSALASRAIMGDKGVHYPYYQLLATFDTLEISIRTNHNYFPPGIFHDNPMTMDELRAIHNPTTVFYAYWGPPELRHFPFETERPTVVRRLVETWIQAIRAEPLVYLRHRARVTLALLGFGEMNPFRKLEYTVATVVGGQLRPVFDYRGPTVFGSPLNRWMLEWYARLGGITLGPTGIVFRAWVYLLLSAACVGVAWHRKHVHRFPIALLGCSSLLYVVPHVLIGFSAELRYMWWPITVSLLQAMMLLAGFARVAPGDATSASAA